MSTSSINRRLALAAAIVLFAGCASKPATDTDLGLDGGPGGPSKYAEQRSGEAAAESDAEHIPPVPHDPAVEAIALEAMPEYARALQAMRAGETDKALVMFQSVASRYPQLSGPLVNQGIIRQQQQKYPKAEEALRQALGVNNRNPYAHNALGLALREQGKFVEARKHYETAIELDPKYARAHFNMGVLAELYLQDLPLALQHFRQYQSLQRQLDQSVANWVVDLERRVPDAVPAAAEPAAEAAAAETASPDAGGDQQNADPQELN
ncbi:MAG: tetratricopeptide repeat protein [Alcanivoracaceae bacterium]|nr:tetratricopeptide repeat protein [Alcanivoracaceae bacterium]